MVIAFDMRGLQTSGQSRGVGVHWREIFRELIGLDSTHHYQLIYVQNKPSADDEIDYPENFQKIRIRLPFFPSHVSTLWLWLSGGHAGFGARLTPFPDCFVDTTFHDFQFPCRPLKRCRSIVWVYDMIPWLCGEGDGCQRKRVRTLAIKQLMRARLDHLGGFQNIIVSSDSTRQALCALTKCPASKIKTIPLGVNTWPAPLAKTPADENGYPEIGLPGRYILYVGALAPHKNLIKLLRAYGKAGKEIELPMLAIVGKIKGYEIYHQALQREIQQLGLMNRIRFLDWVPNPLMAKLYAGAEFFVFPSLHEGFGLPVLEAMVAGCPVLTSDTSSLPEVAGDAAILVNPCDEESMAQGLIRLTRDPSLRKRLSLAGRIRSGQFTWKQTASSLLSLLQHGK